MDVGTIFWVIVAIVFIVGRAIKSARGDAERRNAARSDEGGYEAAPEEIQEFLRSLSTASQRKAAGVEGAPDVEASARPMPEEAPQASFWEAVPAVQAAPAGRPVTEPRPEAGQGPSFWEPMPAVEPAVAPQPALQVRPAHKQPRKKPAVVRKSPPAEVLAARPPATVAPKEPRGGAAPMLVLQGTDLKRAVFWAEVLGPPVSLRHGRRLPPGPQH